MTNVLPIDQGTLGTKAILVDGDGNVVSLSEQAVRPQICPTAVSRSIPWAYRLRSWAQVTTRY